MHGYNRAALTYSCLEDSSSIPHISCSRFAPPSAQMCQLHELHKALRVCLFIKGVFRMINALSLLWVVRVMSSPGLCLMGVTMFCDNCGKQWV